MEVSGVEANFDDFPATLPEQRAQGSGAGRVGAISGLSDQDEAAAQQADIAAFDMTLIDPPQNGHAQRAQEGRDISGLASAVQSGGTQLDKAQGAMRIASRMKHRSA